MPATDAEFQMKWDMIKIGFGLVSGAAIPLVVEFVKRWLFSLRLKVGQPFTKQVKAHGKDNKYVPSNYVKVPIEVTRRGTAKDVRAYLVKLEEFDGSRFREASFFQDALRLRWAYEPQDEELHTGIDIPYSVQFQIDVMSVKDQGGPQPLRIIQCANRHLRFNPEGGLVDQLQSDKKYRFHVVFTAENATTRRIILEVQISPAWGLSVRDVTKEAG
jgi:hypothetical protein